MSKLLNLLKLTNESYSAIQEWETERGEMGVYIKTDTPIGRQEIYGYFMQNETIIYRVIWPEGGVNAAVQVMTDLADFANAYEIAND